jgi:hypothetical protein
MREVFTMRRHVAILAAAVSVVASLIVPALVAAQAPNQSPVVTSQPQPDGTPVPRLPDGRADLSGVWNKAIHQNTSRPVEPLPFTPAGLKAFNEVAKIVDPTSRCVLPGVPRVNNSPYPFQIMQMADRVVFVYEYMHNFRVIYTDGRGHRKNWEPSLMGDSIGRWDGDTLVVDTVNLTDRTWLDDHGNRHSDALHVVERWRRISADQLWYEATVDDPKFYTQPWTTGWVTPLAPKDWEIMEYACTDNNKDLYDGHLQPGSLDGSGRDGSAVATPPPPRQ